MDYIKEAKMAKAVLFFAVRQKEVCMMSYTFLQTSLNDRN